MTHINNSVNLLFPRCKAVRNLSSVLAWLQFFCVVSMLIFRVLLVSSNLWNITEPKSACRPKASATCALAHLVNGSELAN